MDRARPNDEDEVQDQPAWTWSPRKLVLRQGPIHLDHAFSALAWANLAVSTLAFNRLQRAVYEPSAASFFLAAPAAALSHLVLAAQAANLAVVLALAPSVASSIPGRLLLAANGYSFARMAWVTLQSLFSFWEFKRGMARAGIARYSGARAPVASALAALVPSLAVARRFRRVVLARDFEYARLADVDPDLSRRAHRMPRLVKRLQAMAGRGVATKWTSLDVLVADPLPPPRSPVLVYIHGGGWVVGDKMFGGLSVVHRLASLGIVVFNVSYRLAPEAAHPAQILDCKRALAWVKRNCARWNGDPTRVFVMGESAGGHLTALIGTTQNLAQFQPPEDPDADTSVAGVVPVCGVYDWEDNEGHVRRLHQFFDAARTSGDVGMPLLTRAVMQKPLTPETKREFELASPIWHLKQALRTGEDPRLPPFFVIHGTKDEIAPIGGAREFVAELRRVRSRFPATWASKRGAEADVYVENLGEHHATQCYLPYPRAMATADAVADFCFYHARLVV